jgi:hypothetical protein
VLSEVKGAGKTSKRQRIAFGIRCMQILAAGGDPVSVDSLCRQTINELGPDVRQAILAGYAEVKAPPEVSDDDITAAL